jgi:hypothetical protein
MNVELKLLVQIFVAVIGSTTPIKKRLDQIHASITLQGFVFWFATPTSFPLINSIVVTCLSGEKPHLYQFYFLQAGA